METISNNMNLPRFMMLLGMLEIVCLDGALSY